MNLTVRKALAWVAGLTLLWVLLAAFRPSTTFHLAPALIPIMGPLIAVDESAPSSTLRRLVLLAGGWAVVTASILDVSGLLHGPTLLPIGGALLESVVAAAGGTAIGWSALHRLGTHSERSTEVIP